MLKKTFSLLYLHFPNYPEKDIIRIIWKKNKKKIKNYLIIIVYGSSAARTTHVLHHCQLCDILIIIN